MKKNEMNKNEKEVDNVLAEIKAEEFIEQAEANKSMEELEEFDEPVKMGNRCKVADNEIKMSIAKNIGLMIATGVCGYFKLMSPILYIPIELVCLCAVSFKLGEYNGKAKAENR